MSLGYCWPTDLHQIPHLCNYDILIKFQPRFIKGKSATLCLIIHYHLKFLVQRNSQIFPTCVSLWTVISWAATAPLKEARWRSSWIGAVVSFGIPKQVLLWPPVYSSCLPESLYLSASVICQGADKHQWALSRLLRSSQERRQEKRQVAQRQHRQEQTKARQTHESS